MKTWFPPRLRGVLAAAFLLAALAGCREEKLVVGEPAPALAATDPAGEPASLAAWRGQPVFLTFWSAGCGSCIVEMKQLETLARAHDGKVAVVAVNVDAAPPNVQEIRRRHGFTFPLLQDSLGISLERYAVIGTPTSVLVDARGRVVSHHVGMQTPAELSNAFSALAASAPVPATPGT
jgi:peroxiredoxin